MTSDSQENLVPHAHVITKPQTLSLKDFETTAPKKLGKEEAIAKTEELAKQTEELFDLLFYAGQHSLLIVLQGMDTSGKDGTIRHLMRISNAQSVKVAPFKVPTDIERSHDFLWRVHQQAPSRSGITIFNRSHYEDVLVVRVHDLVPKDTWKRRFDQINQFEELLASSSTLILKFFLNISKRVQEERLLAREQEVEKAWKLSVADWKEREHWEDYQKAYADAIGKCASESAPWHIVPSDQKWFRNLAVTEAIVEALKPMRQVWTKDLEDVGKKAKAELAEFRKTKQ